MYITVLYILSILHKENLILKQLFKNLTETSKTTSPFLLQHGFVLVSNSVHRYNIFLLESFYQAGK